MPISQQPLGYALRDQLCRRCKKVDFRHLFSYGLPDPFDFGSPSFGSSDDLARRRRCPFCRLLVDLVQRHSVIRPQAIKDEQWSIAFVTSDDVLSDFSRYPGIPQSSDYRQRDYSVTDSSISSTAALYLAIRSTSSWSTDYLSDIAARYGPSYISTFSESDCVQRRFFRTRHVPTKQANLDTLRMWLKYCGTHEICCRQSSLSIPGLRVIDVLHRRLVDIPKQCKYIALSYV